MTTTADKGIPGAPEPSAGLFVRKSSGLVREIGVRDSFGISLGFLLLLAIYSISPIWLNSFPHGDFYIPILVGAAISLPLGFAYTQLVGAFPRAGGEYIYSSRIFSPPFGAAVGLALLLTACFSCGGALLQIDQLYVPFFFTTLGQALHIHGLVTFGTSTLSHKAAWVIIALIIIAAFAVVTMRPVRTAVKWVFWLFAAGLFIFFFIALALLFESRTGFIHAFNAASGGPAYQEIIAAAGKAGFHPGVTTSATIALLPVGALTYLGFSYGNYTAGEMKRPLKTYKIAAVGAVIVGLGSVLVGWAAMRHVAGLPFMQSSAYLATNHPATYSHLTSVPQGQGALVYATLAASDPVSKILIAFGVLAGWLCEVLAFFVVITRIVFSLSFDRVLPTRLSDVNERTHAPVYAVILVAVLVAIYCVVFNLTSSISAIYANFTMLAYAILVIGSACATALPYRRRDLYEASPKVFQAKVGGVPAVSIVGAISTLGFTALVVDLATKKVYSGGYTLESVLSLAVTALIGIPFYLVARYVNGQRGVDLRLAMQELPPE